jgi:hypothetical protein
MRFTVFTLAALLSFAGAAAVAQADTGWTDTELRPFVGAFIPTGDQRHDLKSAVVVGGQLAYDLPIPMRVVGTLAWSPSKAKEFSNDRTNVFQYDAGAEYAPSFTPNHGVQLSPFIGAGLGARTYRAKDITSRSHTDFDGYGSLGTEVGFGRFGTRLELRDYLSRFKGIMGNEKSSTRNDLMLAGSVAFHL